MSVKVRVVATGKTHNVRVSRGSLDAHCFDAIQRSFDEVMGDPNINDDKKAGFIEKLQKTIDSIQNSSYMADSKEWQTIENSVQSATTTATTEDEGESVFYIIGQILLDHFAKFMKDEDKSAIRRELTNYEDAKNPMDKNAVADKLEELTDHYGLFVHGFLLNISGHNSNNPVQANQALVAYNQFMSALNSGDVQKARDILEANQHLIANISIKKGGGSTTSVGGENH